MQTILERHANDSNLTRDRFVASETSTRKTILMAFPALRKMKLGSQGFEISPLGLGCMSMTRHGGHSHTKSEADMVDLIRSAVDSGVSFLDTSDVYGPHTNEILVGKALKGGYREKVQLATKFGVRWINGKMVACGDPEYVREACEASLKRLDVDCIDLYYQHRIDNQVPIEVTMGELKKLVEEGKIKYVGLSEACGSTIRRAHAVHPLTAVQLEWSIFTRDMEEEVIPTCRELGIGIVAFSPLGRGFLPGGRRMVENLEEGDFRRAVPKLNSENLKLNEPIAEKVAEIAERKGCSSSQVALAWLYEKGGDVCPIPGTTKEENLKQNIGALAVKLTFAEMMELDGLAVTAVGERYPPGILTWKDSETPPLSSWKL